jgi:hypothetical protein
VIKYYSNFSLIFMKDSGNKLPAAGWGNAVEGNI